MFDLNKNLLKYYSQFQAKTVQKSTFLDKNTILLDWKIPCNRLFSELINISLIFITLS